jgi:hypothetical protein
MAKNGEIANEPSAESTVPLDNRCNCTRCSGRPRVLNQRWCRECRAAWKRDQRLQRKTTPVPQTHVENASTTPVTPTPVARESGNTAPPVAKGRDSTEVQLAREVYRIAVAEYERAKNRNWYRSANPPGVILGPLWGHVEAAKRRLRTLGVSPDGEQPPSTPASLP